MYAPRGTDRKGLMITELTTPFVAAKAEVEAKIRSKRPDDYTDIVRLVVETINPGADYGLPDADRIHRIDDGDYQGTLVFVIAEVGYQPNDYWYVRVGYGSCSGCDTLQAISESWDDEKPLTDSEVEGYWTLALHVAQGLKKMGEEA